MSGGEGGMSRGLALRIELGIIGLGVVALVLIFQPFSLGLFSIGCGLVVLAGLVNNLLPMAQPGTRVGSVVFAGLIVALTFCLVLLVSISAAHVYGVFFLKPPAVTASPLPPAAPFWLQPLVWWVAGAAAVFAGLIVAMTRRGG